MKKILLVVALIASPFSMNAQDILVRKGGDVENVKVLEVTPTEVKYKKASNPDGPTFTESRSSLISVRYENGETQKFNEGSGSLSSSGSRLSGNYAYYSEYGKDKRMTNELSLYLQDGWGFGWQLRREFNPYVALNIVGVSFMSGEYTDLANPENFGQCNFRILGGRGYTPSWKWIRGYVDLNMGYSMRYYHIGRDKYETTHHFGLDFSVGVQLHKRVAIGYDLNYITPADNYRDISHWARISVLF